MCYCQVPVVLYQHYSTATVISITCNKSILIEQCMFSKPQKIDLGLKCVMAVGGIHVEFLDL